MRANGTHFDGIPKANSNVAKIVLHEVRVEGWTKKNHLLTGIDKRRRRHCGAVLMIRNIRERGKKYCVSSFRRRRWKKNIVFTRALGKMRSASNYREIYSYYNSVLNYVYVYLYNTIIEYEKRKEERLYAACIVLLRNYSCILLIYTGILSPLDSL